MFHDKKVIDYIYFIDEMALSLDRSNDILIERNNLNSVINMKPTGFVNEYVVKLMGEMVALLNKILYIRRLFNDFPRICDVDLNSAQVYSLNNTIQVSFKEYEDKKVVLNKELYNLKLRYNIIDDLPF